MTPEPLREDPDEENQGSFYTQAWVFYLIMATVGVIWFGGHHKRLDLDLFLDLGSWWIDIALGLAVGVLLVLLSRAAKAFIPAMAELEDKIRALIGRIDKNEALALALLSGFSEELFFRGAMQSSWGWVVATLIFAVMHTGPGAFRLWTLFALIAGSLFAALTLYRGTLLAAMVAHITVNAINLHQLASIDESAASS